MQSHHPADGVPQGLLPRPEDSEAYERVLHGAADRTLRMAERQLAHHHDLESRALKGDLTKAMMGTILAYITSGGSMFDAVYLLLHKKPIQSLATLIVALGSPSAQDLYADFIQPKPKQLSQLPPTLS